MPEFSPADYANADLYDALNNKPGQQPLRIPIDFKAIDRQTKESRQGNPARETPLETALRLEQQRQADVSFKAEADLKASQLKASMQKQIEFNERMRAKAYPNDPAYQPLTQAEIQEKLRLEKLEIEAREKLIYDREQAKRSALKKAMNSAEPAEPRVTSRTPDWEKNYQPKPQNNPRPCNPTPTFKNPTFTKTAFTSK